MYTIFSLINPRIWFPFAAAIPHCSDTVTSALIVNRNSFSFQVVFSTVPPILYCASSFPCPVWRHLHFAKLNSICHFSDHSVNLLISSCKCCLFASLLIFLNTFVSSASFNTLLVMSSSKPLTYIKNKISPNTDILEMCSCVFFSKNCFVGERYPTHHSVDSLNTKSYHVAAWCDVSALKTTHNICRPGVGRASAGRQYQTYFHLDIKAGRFCIGRSSLDVVRASARRTTPRRCHDFWNSGSRCPADAPRRPTMTGRCKIGRQASRLKAGTH